MSPDASSQPIDWTERLALVEETMRTISLHSDPQSLVRSYGEKIQQLTPIDRRMALSRRDLEKPWFRITRSTTWTEEINPWKEKDRLPLLQGGILGQAC